MRHSSIVLASAVALFAATVAAQRSSPQFSFPPPNSLANQFGGDALSGSQDLSLISSQASNQQQQSGAAQSSFIGSQSSPLSLTGSSQSSDQAQLVAQSASSQQQQQPQSQSAANVQQQPNIQLARSSLSLSSLNGNQQQAQQQPQSSRQSQSSVPSSSSSSSAGSAQQHQSSRSQQSAASQPQASQHHRSTAAVAIGSPLGSSSSSSSSSSAGAHGNSHRQHVHTQPAQQQQQHVNQLHPHLQTQQTSQSLSGSNNQQAIEAARRAEATAASLAAASGQSYHCPDSFGFFRHHKSCDKYWACENGTSTLKLCGNGLMFDDSDPKRENCAYPFSVDCGADRTDLEAPVSTPHCPRLYGLFADNANCRVFYSCWNGEASKYECPPGLAYDNEQHVCVWADLVERCDQSEVSDGFVCPDPTEVDQPGHYTRHAHPTDCRKFYVCIEGVARPYGCSFGSVFNVDSLQCDEPENVSGCEKYYGDMDPKLAKKLARENTQGQSLSSQGGGPASSSTSSRTSSSSSSSSSSSGNQKS